MKIGIKHKKINEVKKYINNNFECFLKMIEKKYMYNNFSVENEKNLKAWLPNILLFGDTTLPCSRVMYTVTTE